MELRAQNSKSTFHQFEMNILEALPKEFTFYDLGWVRFSGQSVKNSIFHVKSDRTSTHESQTAIAFQVSGDLSFWFIISFEKERNLSIYSELGNIITSKMLTYLNTQSDLELILSPPHPLANSQFNKMIDDMQLVPCGVYAHYYQESTIPIDTWIMPASTEGSGNA